MTLKSEIIGKDSSLLNHSEHHDSRYFAMLNAAVALAGNSKLEGGSPSEAFAYYNYLLASELPDDAPRSLQLTTNDKQLAALKTCMTNLINIYNLLVENFVLSGISTNDLMSSQLQTVLTVIKQNIKEAGVCYFPSGFTGEPGHFAGLKIKQLLNGNYIFSLINHGNGMRYHRELTESGRKKKCCYQSDAYEIDLNSENGQELLQRVIELCFDSRKASDSEKIVNPYSADDLYGLLKLYGDEWWVDKINEKSVTAQRTGSCTVTNVHAIARDILIDNDADFKTRKRYHFVLKLRSLIAAFEEYKQNKYSHSVVFWALQEFSVRLNKQYGDILSAEEMIYCAQLQTQIQERLKNDEQGALEKNVQ